MSAPTPTAVRRPGAGLPADSLATSLLGAARACLAVRDGRTLRDGLDAARQARPDGNAGAVHDLAARALRRRGRADLLLDLIGQRVPSPPLLRELLVVAIALMVDAIPRTTDAAVRLDLLPYSPFTLVDQAVRAAASDPELARGKAFVNAVLRTLLRRLDEQPAAIADALYGPSAPTTSREELPAWWLARLKRAYRSEWPAIVAGALENPPLVLRVNRRRGSRAEYLARLAEAGIAASPIGDDEAVRLDRPLPVDRIPGFAEGWVSVQDEAAQRSAPLLDVHDGMRVLDACAAPGGKTGHILERNVCDLVAIDVEPARLRRVRENLDRLGLDAQLVVGDAVRPESWWDGRGFDRILADVPCTASGVLRRHPDIRWLRREADLARLSRTAQQITDALWSLLNPGGRFLLVTCSVFPEESADHATAFAARHADARVLPAPGQLLPSATGANIPQVERPDHDGLFFALFEKMR
jgi:16S rRNA (cytosine967-C5)-methyltransferase